MSEYEREQVTILIKEIYYQYGRGLDKDECMSNCWLAYAEIRKTARIYYDEKYWGMVAERMLEYIREMRDKRNKTYKLESRLSLNQSIGECKAEIGTLIVRSYGDFTKSVIMWDFARGLSEDKYRIIQYMVWGEDDSYIMQVMDLIPSQYYAIKDELREDMKRYINA